MNLVIPESATNPRVSTSGVPGCRFVSIFIWAQLSLLDARCGVPLGTRFKKSMLFSRKQHKWCDTGIKVCILCTIFVIQHRCSTAGYTFRNKGKYPVIVVSNSV